MRHFVLALALAVALAAPALAHLTPPVVLASDRDAVVSLLSGARRFFVREVRLGDKEKAAIKQASGWTPDEDFYRFYIGRDDQARMVGALVFVADTTIHGSIRVATAFGPDGKIRGASVVELTEETYPWVKPLIDEQFTQDWVGLDSGGRFALSDRLARARQLDDPVLRRGHRQSRAPRSAALRLRRAPVGQCDAAPLKRTESARE